jgi:hypothetical protein
MTHEVFDDTLVVETVRALEAASSPLRPREWYALADAQLRATVETRLRAIGRELIEVGEQDGKPGGYLTGWSDASAPVIAARRAGLQMSDLAVLSIIYLHSYVLETVLGEQTIPLDDRLGTHEGPDGRDIVSAGDLEDCLQRLRSRELVDRAKRLGPALQRLSPSQRRRLDDNLLLLCRPNSLLARQIRQERAQQARSEAAG